jgi:hypothetical protein
LRRPGSSRSRRADGSRSQWNSKNCPG